MSKKRSQAVTQDVEFALWQENRSKALIESKAIGLARVNALAVTHDKNHMDKLAEIISANPIPAIKPYVSKKKVKTQRILNLCLSDLHFGSEISARETGKYVYSVTEEARRMGGVLEQVLNFKRHYRDETELYLHLIGDIIEGKLHDPQNAAPMAEQKARARWYLLQFILHCSQEFKKVKVFCVSGNHGRDKARHHDRAINQKWDSHETDIYEMLAGALAGATKNVDVEVFTTPFYRWKAFDKTGYATHGDTHLNVGFPGKAINVQKIVPQVLALNNDIHCDMYMVGHVHTASDTLMNHNIVLVTNGCLVPSGEYTQANCFGEAACAQQMWESVPGHIFGDHRRLEIGPKEDARKDLESLIKPFPGMCQTNWRKVYEDILGE